MRASLRSTTVTFKAPVQQSQLAVAFVLTLQFLHSNTGVGLDPLLPLSPSIALACAPLFSAQPPVSTPLPPLSEPPSHLQASPFSGLQATPSTVSSASIEDEQLSQKLSQQHLALTATLQLPFPPQVPPTQLLPPQPTSPQRLPTTSLGLDQQDQEGSSPGSVQKRRPSKTAKLTHDPQPLELNQGNLLAANGNGASDLQAAQHTQHTQQGEGDQGPPSAAPAALPITLEALVRLLHESLQW